MGDPAALQEAIQRARQLAAKIGQPPHKRTADELTGGNDSRPDSRTSSNNQYQSSHKQDSGGSRHEPVDYGAILKKARIERGELSPSDTNDNSNGGNNNNNTADKTNVSSNGSSNNDSTSYSGYPSRNFNNSEQSNNYYGTQIGRADKSAGPVSYQHGPTSAASVDIYSHLASPMGTTRLLPPSDHHTTATGSSDYGTVNQNKVDILIPQQVIGLVIGKGGENIKRIQNETGATVRVDPSTMDEQGNKMCNINGSADSVKRASTLVNDIIENALASKRPRAPVEGGDEYRLKIPAQRTGAIIGRGGDTIRSIKQQSGCDIELDKNAKDCGPEETVFIIRGTQERIQTARELIQAKLASGRGPPSSGSQHSSGGQPRQKAVATGANAAPLASYNDLPSSYTGSWPQQQASVGSGASGAPQSVPSATGQPQASADNAAAWTAYYAQYYAQYQAQAQAQSMSSVAYPGQAALTAPTTTAAIQQYKSTASEPAVSTAGQTSQQQADYSAQWVEYYKAMGYHKEAEAIEQRMKQQQQQQQQTPQQHKQ